MSRSIMQNLCMRIYSSDNVNVNTDTRPVTALVSLGLLLSEPFDESKLQSC